MRACMFTNGRVCLWEMHGLVRLGRTLAESILDSTADSSLHSAQMCTKQAASVAKICNAATLLAPVFHVGLQAGSALSSLSHSLFLSLGMTASPILISLSLVSRTQHFFNQIKSLKIQIHNRFKQSVNSHKPIPWHFTVLIKYF